MKIFDEEIIVLAPDGRPTPGRLGVIRTPTGFQATTYCRDNLFYSASKTKKQINSILWTLDDEIFLHYVRSIFEGNLPDGVSIRFDFARPELQSVGEREAPDDMVAFTMRAAGRLN